MNLLHITRNIWESLPYIPRNYLNDEFRRVRLNRPRRNEMEELIQGEFK